MATRPHEITEVAAFLGLHPSTLSRRRQGRRICFDDGTWLETIRLGRRLVVPEAELRRFLGEGDNRTDPQSHPSDDRTPGTTPAPVTTSTT